MAEKNTLLEKVLSLQDKFASLQNQLSDPAVMSDMKKYVQLNKDYKELEPIIKAGLDYKKMVDELASAKDIMANEKDEDLKEMAREEIAEIEPKLPEMEQNIKLLLIPSDPDDSKNAMVEIRGGTGGDEAAISPATSSGCIPSMQSVRVGNLRFPIRLRVLQAVSSRLCSNCHALTVFTVR